MYRVYHIFENGKGQKGHMYQENNRWRFIGHGLIGCIRSTREETEAQAIAWGYKFKTKFPIR